MCVCLFWKKVLRCWVRVGEGWPVLSWGGEVLNVLSWCGKRFKCDKLTWNEG